MKWGQNDLKHICSQNPGGSIHYRSVRRRWTRLRRPRWRRPSLGRSRWAPLAGSWPGPSTGGGSGAGGSATGSGARGGAGITQPFLLDIFIIRLSLNLCTLHTFMYCFDVYPYCTFPWRFKFALITGKFYTSMFSYHMFGNKSFFMGFIIAVITRIYHIHIQCIR